MKPEPIQVRSVLVGNDGRHLLRLGKVRVVLGRIVDMRTCATLSQSLALLRTANLRAALACF